MNDDYLPPWLLSNERNTVWEAGGNPDDPAEYERDDYWDDEEWASLVREQEKRMNEHKAT